MPASSREDADIKKVCSGIERGLLGDQHPALQLENSPHPGPNPLRGVSLCPGTSLGFAVL